MNAPIQIPEPPHMHERTRIVLDALCWARSANRKDLAEICGLEPQEVSSTLNVLREKGYVEKGIGTAFMPTELGDAALASIKINQPGVKKRDPRPPDNPALMSQRTRDVLSALAAGASGTRNEISEIVGFGAEKVTIVLCRLARYGYVSVSRDLPRSYSITPDGMAVAEQLTDVPAPPVKFPKQKPVPTEPNPPAEPDRIDTVLADTVRRLCEPVPRFKHDAVDVLATIAASLPAELQALLSEIVDYADRHRA